MASVHRDPKSPKGVWYAAYYLADGRRALRSTKQKDKQKALQIAHAWAAVEREARLRDVTQDRVIEVCNETLKRCGIAPIERISVEGWLQGWLESSRSSVKPSSLVAYSQAVALFLEFLGENGARRRLESITERDIEAFTAELVKSGRQPSTINNLVRKFLSVPFEKARKTGKIRYNPIQATSALKTQAAPKETFTPEQVRALLEVADNDWQGAILFAYGTGTRLGDVASLKWSALDLERGIVVFREGKTGSSAIKGLHADFLEWVKNQPVVPFDRDQPVFPALAGRSLDGLRGLSKTFTDLCDQAGIEKRLIRQANAGKGRSVRALSFHSFRHTAATQVFNQAALKEITRRVTNHAAGGSLDRYLHEDIEAIQAATNLIPRLPK
jgi:integrase